MLKYKNPAEQMIPTTAISHMITIRGSGIIMNSKFVTVSSFGILSEKEKQA